MIMSEERDNLRELLSAYIDGEVTSEQSRAVEQAVAKDPELALELHELTATKRLVTGLSKERAPRGFVRKVMARAERKHLLGDHHAGGAFSAARWITMAVAAVVLLTAGIGIIAINMLGTGQAPLPIANVDDVDPAPGGPGGAGFNVDSLHGKAGNIRNEEAAKGEGGRLVVADEALDYAVANAKNTTIYTHEVSNTLAVLHKSFDRNDVLPLELETPTRDSKVDEKLTGKGDGVADDKPAGTVAAETQNVSRGGLNFYYNKKQDTEQVQIVVLATDTVIEQINGDIDKLADDQMVSQAPAPDLRKARFDGGYVARRAGPRRTQQDTESSDPGGAGVTIARVDDDNNGLGTTSRERKAGTGERGRTKSKVIAKGAIDQPSGKKDPAPAVTVAPKIVTPTVDPSVSGGGQSVRPSDVTGADATVVARPAPKQPGKGVSSPGNTGAAKAPATAIDSPEGKKYELADKGGGTLKVTPAKPGPAKRSIAGPTTRPAESLQVAGRIRKDILDNKDNGELEALSSKIAAQQKRGESSKELEQQYSKLNSAFRQRIWNDDVRRNVQSQQEKGINIQALVININRRSLRKPAKRTIRLRDGGALSRPRATTTSSPASGSTTQKAAPPVDTSR
jgi:hypothetical protein